MSRLSKWFPCATRRCIVTMIIRGVAGATWQSQACMHEVHDCRRKGGGCEGDKRGGVDVRSEPHLSHGLATRTALLYSRLPRVRRYLRGRMPCSGHAPSGTHAAQPRSASGEAPEAPKRYLPRSPVNLSKCVFPLTRADTADDDDLDHPSVPQPNRSLVSFQQRCSSKKAVVALPLRPVELYQVFMPPRRSHHSKERRAALAHDCKTAVAFGRLS